jgi:transcriptional regulator with XRE-family HTH domain
MYYCDLCGKFDLGKPMKNTKELRDWIVDMATRKGCPAEYSRFVGVSHASLSLILNGRTVNLKASTVEALCRAEGITEEQLLSISKGKSPFVIKEDAAALELMIDDANQIAAWLRMLPKEKQQIIYGTARAMGFETKAERLERLKKK